MTKRIGGGCHTNIHASATLEWHKRQEAMWMPHRNEVENVNEGFGILRCHKF
jgi:hypothetical protein